MRFSSHPIPIFVVVDDNHSESQKSHFGDKKSARALNSGQLLPGGKNVMLVTNSKKKIDKIERRKNHLPIMLSYSRLDIEV